MNYLLKILDVEKNLYIKVNKKKKQEEIGFEKENEKGIELKSNISNYKENNKKKEMMIALSDFWF
ncbi:mannose-6-phosphate isomerase, class I, partial [Pasteurella multocida]|uniref:type I phosphomannose isomerase catalytic subunit n=1 Tax=Pasteurella multocida TaxID=747 RepID=UPI0017BB561C|nr:mannose-6-phosphate isomerase, class I [Pasteurella multocida]